LVNKNTQHNVILSEAKHLRFFVAALLRMT
jgi:hypothetical protein